MNAETSSFAAEEGLEQNGRAWSNLHVRSFGAVL